MVHEAYIRLVDGNQTQHWNSRGHFFGAAAEAMRRILVESARQKPALKRGGDRQCVDLVDYALPETNVDLLVLDEALVELALHHPERARLVMLRFLAGLINGLDRDEVLDPKWEQLTKLKQQFTLHPEIAEVAAGSFREKAPPDIVGSGYVVKSLEAALWAFHDSKDFREAVLKAVNLGDDLDTTGAVCGQLAGAYWGESGIPGEWLGGLARKDMIETALGGLLDKR